MKDFKIFLLVAFTLLTILVGCADLEEGGIVGILEINRKSGWDKLTFKDAETGKNFDLGPGQYRIVYQNGVFGIRHPKIQISTVQGQVLGHMEIPRQNLKKDGSFEIYVAQEGNTNSFNILGGRKKNILSRERYTRIKASCTYQLPYSCTQVNAQGQISTTICYRTVYGDQDQVWEKVTYYNTFRILFDGNDLMNVAVFRAQGQKLVDNIHLASDSCR